MTRSLVLVLVLAGCTRTDPEPPPPAKHYNPGGVPNDPDIADKATAARLEKEFHSDSFEGYVPEGDELVTVRNGAVTTEPLPPALHKHGETIASMWVAPDHTLFAAGYMITGKPGPDTGAIYRREPKGKLEVVFTKAAHELFGIAGCSATDVWAVGKATLVHFDGKAWTEQPLQGFTGDPLRVYCHGSALWLFTTTGQDQSQIYRRTGTGWQLEATVACFLRTIDGFDSSVWAGGACDAVYRRNDNGKWPAQSLPPHTKDLFHIAAISKTEAFAVTGTALLHSTGGAWSEIELPLEGGRVWEIAAAGPKDVFALATVGIFHGPGAWKKIAFDGNACQVLLGDGDTLYCMREKRRMVHGAQP